MSVKMGTVKIYPESIQGQEAKFIKQFLMNENGQLKAAAISPLPAYLKEALTNHAKGLGLNSPKDLTECIYWVVNDLHAYPKTCASCQGPITKFHSFSRGYPHLRCSTKCSNSDKAVKIAKVEASKKKYGTDFPVQSKQVKEKIRASFVGNWFDDRFQRFAPEYTPVTTQHEYEGSRTKFTWKHSCGHIFQEDACNGVLKPMCPACRDDLKITRPQRDIVDFIKTFYDGIVVLNDRRTIHPLELDIYLPELKLAIEYNGLYWHSYGQLETNEERSKHKTKTDICDQHGIRLIQIWEHEWEEKKEIVKSRLKSIFGVDQKTFARKCIVQEVTNSEAKDFQNQLHIQGHTVASVKLGLFHDNQLVALMTFGKPRFSKQYEWELIRYCSKGTVIGGASKLMAHFINKHMPKSIVTYADRRWSVGNMYFKLGFSEVKKTEPNYFYFKGCQRYQRYSFQKKKIATIVENYDPHKSESANAFMNGFRRVWDAGNILLVWQQK